MIKQRLWAEIMLLGLVFLVLAGLGHGGRAYWLTVSVLCLFLILVPPAGRLYRTITLVVACVASFEAGRAVFPLSSLDAGAADDGDRIHFVLDGESVASINSADCSPACRAAVVVWGQALLDRGRTVELYQPVTSSPVSTPTPAPIIVPGPIQ